MDSFLNIKYKQVSVTENFEDFLKHNGINVLMRKAVMAVNPECELTKEGDFYTFVTITPIKNLKITFKPNIEFDVERFDGSKIKSTVTFDGTTMTQIEVGADGKKIKHIRVFSADKIIMTTTQEGWDGECTKVFEKVK